MAPVKKVATKRAPAKKTAAKAAPAQDPVVHKTGASITHCVITNKAASVKKHASQALERAADAVIENAKAIQEIARSLKGAEAHMQHGIYLNNIRADSDD